MIGFPDVFLPAADLAISVMLAHFLLRPEGRVNGRQTYRLAFVDDPSLKLVKPVDVEILDLSLNPLLPVEERSGFLARATTPDGWSTIQQGVTLDESIHRVGMALTQELGDLRQVEDGLDESMKLRLRYLQSILRPKHVPEQPQYSLVS